MIIVRAPLRISFAGGGSDLAAFYKKATGRVISGAIDKYVYVTITRTPTKNVSVRYSASELVRHPKELVHNRVREALLDHKITRGIEISSFSQLPGQTGLGSSSAFSVALIKGLHALKGKKINSRTCAEEACRLEIDLVGEPIGKQDQYASAFGGINVLQFNKNGSVIVDPVRLDYKKRNELEDNLLLFFTGILREASSILTEQKKNTGQPTTFQTLKHMADSVHDFKGHLMHSDYKNLGNMLHEGWERKRTLASKISHDSIDDLYASAREAGALGGKLLGAGGGGCLLFFVEPSKRKVVARALASTAHKHNLTDAAVIPFSFVYTGAEIIHEQ